MQKKIKIAFTIPNFNTAGSGKALLNLALGLDKEKFEAHVVCESDKGAFFQTVKDSGIPVHVFNYLPNRKPLMRFGKELWKATSVWKKIKPDVVHSFHYSDNYTEAIAARLAGAKWVFTKKNMSWGGSSGNGWKFRSWLANAIAVQNTDMVKQFYPNEKKVMLIPRGVDTSRFKSGPAKPEIREEMQTALQQRIIICVANMVPVKGVELLIEAFANLSTQFTGWSLWLVGDINNEYGRELQQKTKLLDLEKRIRFSGKKPNVVDYLNHAEVFILPTKDEGRREGSPVALLEAMANGKVVIGSAVPGVKDQLANFPDHLFIPGSVPSLQEKLAALIQNNTPTNQHLGSQFSALVNEFYRIDIEVKRHEEFYEKVMNGNDTAV